ncbi:MAG TPA: helix-turn-helix domain-containing protein [Streptosporangiaceae bacterium]|nr:helix-turn-helix domain-containing protein [Streptosporangiaceae bacterium]
MSEQEQPPGPEPLAVRSVASVGMLRALADPTRLAILSALMERHDDLPVMSVKELAARLGQSQTKLYRHVRQLEAAGLIRVASTRLVSGIVEQRYQASQRDLTFDGGFLREHADESDAAMRAMLERFRDGFVTAFRDKRLAPDALPDAEAYRKPALLLTEVRVSPTRAIQMREKLQEFQKWLGSVGDEDPDGILVDVLVGYYVTPELDPM